MLISSVLLALVHIYTVQIVFALILGWIFVLLFITTKSLTCGILLHAVANLSSILIGMYLMKISFSPVGNDYMIYGEWTYYIIGISMLLTVFLAAKM